MSYNYSVETRFFSGPVGTSSSSPKRPPVSTFPESPIGEAEESSDIDGPTAFHLRFNAPSDDAIEVDKKANDLLRATSDIQVW